MFSFCRPLIKMNIRKCSLPLHGFHLNKIITLLVGKPRKNTHHKKQSWKQVPKYNLLLSWGFSPKYLVLKIRHHQNLKVETILNGILWFFASLSTAVPGDDEILRHLCVLNHGFLFIQTQLSSPSVFLCNSASVWQHRSNNLRSAQAENRQDIPPLRLNLLPVRCRWPGQLS